MFKKNKGKKTPQRNRKEKGGREQQYERGTNSLTQRKGSRESG